MTIIDTPIGPMDVAAEGTYGAAADADMSTPLWVGMARIGTLDRFVADLAAVGYDESALTGPGAATHARLVSQADAGPLSDLSSASPAPPVAYQLSVVDLASGGEKPGRLWRKVVLPIGRSGTGRIPFPRRWMNRDGASGEPTASPLSEAACA